MEAGKKKDRKEQAAPLDVAAAASPSVVPVSIGGDAEENVERRWRSIQYLRRRRCALLCCGCCGATVVLLGVLVLILSLTVFRVKDPTLTTNSITLDRFSADLGSGALNGGDLVLVNATLIADISIKNPNVASFKFAPSSTEFYVAGETVGVAYVPAGTAGAGRTARMNMTVDVLTNNAARQINVTAGMLVGEGTAVNMTSFTDLTGRVNVLGIYKRDIEVLMNCSMTLMVSTSTQSLQNVNCAADVK